MPELPEVETIRNYLRLGGDDQPSLLGGMIQSVEILWARSIAFPTPGEFQERVTGQTILEIGRRGKYLIFQLSDDHLLLHLKMSGDILVRRSIEPMNPYDRVLFHMDKEIDVAFNDTRKFGRIWLVADAKQVVGALGPEPFDHLLSHEVFHEMLVSSHRQLKPLLLDQSFLAGLGNIYTDEALHLAHIHPLTRSDRLTIEQTSLLLDSIRTVLEQGIRSHGASIDWVYRGGNFQNYFRVYQRTGLACVECGTPIARIVIGQRSTHYCPVCQSHPE